MKPRPSSWTPSKKKKLEKMTLVGHSLGAYMSVAHALKYQTRVTRLMLLPPAGVPRDPSTTMPSKEITDNQADEAGYVLVNDVQPATKAKVEENQIGTEEAYPSSFVCCDVDFDCECYFFRPALHVLINGE